MAEFCTLYLQGQNKMLLLFYLATNYTTSSHKQSFFHVDCYFVAVLPDMVTLFYAIASQCGFSDSRALRDDIHPLIHPACDLSIKCFFFFIESRQGANGAFWITRRRRTAPARLSAQDCCLIGSYSPGKTPGDAH